MTARDEADGPTVVLTSPIARKQKEMDSSAQILFSFHSVQDLSLGLPTSINPPRNSLTDMPQRLVLWLF